MEFGLGIVGALITAIVISVFMGKRPLTTIVNAWNRFFAVALFLSVHVVLALWLSGLWYSLTVSGNRWHVVLGVFFSVLFLFGVIIAWILAIYGIREQYRSEQESGKKEERTK